MGDPTKSGWLRVVLGTDNVPEHALRFSKAPHAKGCTGSLYRRPGTVLIDRTGRVGNGGIVAHDYRCNRAWGSCPARVLVCEAAVRALAVAVEQRS